MIKEISTKGKTIQTKQDFPKQRKIFLPTTGGRGHESIPTRKKLNDFGQKYENQKKKKKKKSITKRDQ